LFVEGVSGFAQILHLLGYGGSLVELEIFLRAYKGLPSMDEDNREGMIKRIIT
jgi:hypothetical protein